VFGEGQEMFLQGKEFYMYMYAAIQKLIFVFLVKKDPMAIFRRGTQALCLVPCGAFIMPKILEILVGSQIERSVSVPSDWNIRNHLWRGPLIPVRIFQPKFVVPCGQTVSLPYFFSLM